MEDIKVRRNRAVHTLQHANIRPEEFAEVARAYQGGRVTTVADILRERARSAIVEAGIIPDEYMAENSISIEVIEPPLPAAILGALALLGTSEARLINLEPLIHG